MEFEGPVTVGGKTFMSRFDTGKALSFWLSLLCANKGTEVVPRLNPSYMITMPLIQVRALEGTPGVGPQEMQAFAAKDQVMLGGEDLGLHYFGAVFHAENVFGEAEQVPARRALHTPTSPFLITC